jgi:glycosyltransferase involved in cell wall biosynthesis
MIYLALPTGAGHGWGIVGMGLARAMARLAPGNVRLLTDPFTPDSVGDELVYRDLAALLPRAGEPGSRPGGGVTMLDGPLVMCAVDKQFNSAAPQWRGTKTVCHAVFEENIFQPAWIAKARQYDVIATASTWCTKVLTDCGLGGVQTAIQGIDPAVFYPLPGELADNARDFLRGQFVIFSGGKFEYRKAQDVVIRAVKVLQDRHKDVFLVNAWFNPWPQSFETMRASPHLAWPVASGPYVEVMNKLLAHNGLDLARVVTMSPRTNGLMARIYRNSDVGLFPNRCEGGTNLVMMEYMGCGKPVVATAATGQADVIKEGHALVIKTKGEVTLSGPAGPLARWPEPDLEDTVEKLERAYQHRGEMAALGGKAGEVMKRQFTWEDTAKAFLRILGA